VWVVNRYHLLLADRGIRICQHGSEGRNVLEFGSETSTDNIIRRGHALDDITGEVRMDIVGLEEHGLANFKFDVVEKELHEEPNVARELAVQTDDEVSEFFAAV